MVFILLLLPLLAPVIVGLAHDPAPGLTQSKVEARNLICARQGEAVTRRQHPGSVEEPRPRGDFLESDVVACQGRLVAYGDRPDRDELILSELQASATDIVQAAVALGPRVGIRTWLVEAFYPDAAITGKITFAVKTALVERHQQVSDRVPILAAGDILVLGTTPAAQAYPLACRRYHAQGSVGPGEALLGVVLLHARETALHAGLCVDGVWQWLR